MTATRRSATLDDFGRSCPYCRYPFDKGSLVDECGACHAVHHEDCWADGGGCAVVGCAGAGTAVPTTAALPSPVAPAAAPPTGPAFAAPVGAPSWPTAPPPGPPPTPARGRGPLYALLALLATLIVAGGVGGALLVAGGDGDGGGEGDGGSTLAGVATVRAEEPDLAGDAAAAPTAAPEATPTTDDGAADDAPGATAGAAASGTELGRRVQGDGYSIASPGAGWVRDHTDRLFADERSRFYETKWHLKGRPEIVALVDYTPGFGGSAREGAAGVREAYSQATEHAFEAIGGDDWLFEFTTGGVHKYDRFSSACGSGWAVLGSAPATAFARYRDRFAAFAASLEPDC